MWQAWDEELPFTDPKRDHLLDGIRDGFHIVDSDKVQQPTVEVNNYKSATNNMVRHKVEKQIHEELQNGRYVQVGSDDKPYIVSAIGAIPKKDSDKVRLIHDCSQPQGHAVNNFAVQQLSEFKYQTVNDAAALVTPGAYMAKIDLASAYRSVKIHPSNYKATGLKWTFEGDTEPTYMVDTRLPFGARRSPEVFNDLTQAVRRIMAHKGFSIVAYLDDFFLVGDTYEECWEAMQVLLRLLRKLGFAINYSKIEGPTTSLVFLGILLDSVRMVLELPQRRLHELRKCLLHYQSRAKVTKKDLQSLAGKLNWASQCVYGGRFHLRRILDRIATLKQPWHRTRVTSDMKADMAWWIQFMSVFNGITPMVDNRPGTAISTDACPVASGACFANNWVYTRWDNWPGTQDLHINFKEVLAVEPAVMQPQGVRACGQPGGSRNTEQGNKSQPGCDGLTEADLLGICSV